MTSQAEPRNQTSDAVRAVHPALAILIGAVCALVALVPWILEGGRQPVQNLWADGSFLGEMPIVLLPLGNYSVATTSALLVIGAAFAGAAVAIARGLHRTLSARLVLLGLLIVQVAALAHSAYVLTSGLGDGRRDQLYAGSLVGGALMTIALGVLIMLGIASAKPAPATLAIAASAVALNVWLPGLVLVIVPEQTVLPTLVWQSVSWLPAVITGIAVGWCGVRTVGRAVASVAAVLMIWIGPAFVTAVSYGLGTRIYLQYPAELLPASKQVFGLALGSTGQGPQRVAITVAVALLAWLAFAARDRMRAGAATAPGAPEAPAASLTDAPEPGTTT